MFHYSDRSDRLEQWAFPLLTAVVAFLVVWLCPGKVESVQLTSRASPGHA